MKKNYLIMLLVAFALTASIQKNYAQCGVSFSSNVTTSTASFFVFHPDSFATGSYNWSFGDGGTSSVKNATHTYSSAGTYVVTVNFVSATDSLCTPSFTDSVVITSTCNLTSTVSSTNTTCLGCSDGTATVTAAGGTMPYNYSWSNGPTTASNTGLYAGEYSVTVTDAASCSVTHSVIVSNPVQTSFSISGSVSASGTPVDIYWLTFYRQDSATSMYYNYADEVVTSDTSNIYFTIPDFIPGQYLVKASPYPGSTVAIGYLPTYYGDSTSWSGATPITVSNFDITGISINLLFNTNTDTTWHTGNDIIKGVITQDTTGFEGGRMAAGTPVRNTTVNMYSNSGILLDFNLTDDNGEFKFSGIAAGDYAIRADFPGYNLSLASVTMDGDSTTETSITMDMNQNGSVTVGIYNTQKLAFNNILVYPNPAKDMITISTLPFSKRSAKLKITSLLGQTLYNEEISLAGEELKINTSSWLSGIYLISIQTEEATATGKLIIQD